MLTTLPSSRLVQCYAKRSCLSLQFLQGKEREPVWTSSTPSIVGHFLAVPIPILPHRNCRRVCGTWPLGIWLWWRSGEGLATTSSQISENWVPSCNAQEVVPASGFICRAMTRELTRMQICLIQVLKTHGMAECIKKQNPMICCLKGTQRLSEEMEKILQINGNQHKIQE